MPDFSTGTSGVGGFLRRVLRRKAAVRPVETFSPLSVLEEIQAGSPRDYCLYLPPTLEGNASAPGSGADVERMMIAAFAPLPVLPLDETRGRSLPDESFRTLAVAARVLWLVPTDDEAFFARLRLLKEEGPLERCIFLMPDAGNLGQADRERIWSAARTRAAEMGIEPSAYTPGGWLFRLGPDGKACTFRPIVNPNPEKIAKALEAICGEMQS